MESPAWPFAAFAPWRQIDATMTPQMVDEIAFEHAKGRRLYVGTTEMEGRRFVLWDIGAIASRGTAEDRELIKLCLPGSSAMPGFFPPARIPPVTLVGAVYELDTGTVRFLKTSPKRPMLGNIDFHPNGHPRAPCD